MGQLGQHIAAMDLRVSKTAPRLHSAVPTVLPSFPPAGVAGEVPLEV